MTAAVSPRARPIRHLPRYQIVARLKLRGVRQRDIAQATGTTSGYVSHVLSRRAGATPLAERVWREVEVALGDSQSNDSGAAV